MSASTAFFACGALPVDWSAIAARAVEFESGPVNAVGFGALQGCERSARYAWNEPFAHCCPTSHVTADAGTGALAATSPRSDIDWRYAPSKLGSAEPKSPAFARVWTAAAEVAGSVDATSPRMV